MNNQLSYIEKHAKKSDLSFKNQTFNLDSIGELLFGNCAKDNDFEEQSVASNVTGMLNSAAEMIRTSGHLFQQPEKSHKGDEDEGSHEDMKIARVDTVKMVMETQKNEEN